LSKVIGHNITKIKIVSGRYLKKSITGLDNLTFPLKIISINTKGKFLWFVLKNDKGDICYLLNTFGLTGEWSFDKLEHCSVKFTIKKNDNADELYLYFCDVRNFGTIQFTNNDKILNKKLNELAPDMLQSNISEKDFTDIIKSLKNKKQKIVQVLMSQNKKTGIISGLGNYLVPEILYRARISPHKKINELSSNDISILYAKIKYVLKLCYLTNNTPYVAHLSSFLKKHTDNVKKGKYPNYLRDVKIGNDKFQFLVYRKKIDLDGNEIIGEKILNGRTTYWCPSVQK